MKQENLNKAKLINSIVFLIGLALTLAGIIARARVELIYDICFSIGISLIASTLVIFINFIFEAPQKISDMYKKWGIDAIYETRSAMNKFAAEHLNTIKHCYDIVGFGLKSLRDTQSELLEKKVIEGINVRILTINPNSNFLMQRELDERKNPGDIKKTILDLENWVKSIKVKYPGARGNIEIKFYDAIPLDHYCRQDEIVFVGGHQYGKDSQQSITYQFKKSGLGYDMYTAYFERLWLDTNFSKDQY